MKPGPTGEALSQRQTEPIDPLLVPVERRPNDQSLPIGVPQVEEDTLTAGELLAQAQDVPKQLRQVQRRDQARDHLEQGLGVATLVTEHVPQDASSLSWGRPQPRVRAGEVGDLRHRKPAAATVARTDGPREVGPCPADPMVSGPRTKAGAQPVDGEGTTGSGPSEG
jgi:hypothetical protein